MWVLKRFDEYVNPATCNHTIVDPEKENCRNLFFRKIILDKAETTAKIK